MKKVIRITVGLTLILCGIGLLLFSGYILVEEFSWPILIVSVAIFGVGFAVIKLGYAALTARGIHSAFTFIARLR